MADGTADPAMMPASAVCPLETPGCHPYGSAPEVCPLRPQGCRGEAVTHWGERAPGWGLPRAAPQKHKQKGCGSLSAQGNEASSLFPPLLNQRAQGALPRAAETQKGEAWARILTWRRGSRDQEQPPAWAQIQKQPSVVVSHQNAAVPLLKLLLDLN